jgi:phosphatidylinositol alpha-1,6-mannosyltransferase
MRRARRVLCVSRYTRDMSIRRGAPPDRAVVMPVGTDPDRFRPPADREGAKRALGLEGRTVLLTVARLVRRKGHTTVLRALPAIVDRFPNTLYVIAGDGPLRPELDGLASQLKIEEHVRFLGEVAYDRDVPSLYPAADVFVLTSESDTMHGVEGFGIVFLEAASCETPVVGTRAGGIPDAVEDGVTGRLVDSGSPEQTADAVIRILSDPGLARRMGRAGRERVMRDFTWRRIAERTLEQLSA